MKPEHVSGKPGVLFFIHGGVWIVGNFQNHQRLLRDLVVGSGQIGVFVEYTPLPAAKFPTQLEECYAALNWVAEHASELGADGSRIAVAGNSVGGNMTAALMLWPRTATARRSATRFCSSPRLTPASTPPRTRNSRPGRFLSRAFMKYGWDRYAPDEKTRNNPYVSPLRASLDELKGLPPALVVTAGNDPLRDEGEAYARKLKEAGVSVDAVRYNGTIHDFMALNALRHLPSTEAAIKQANDGVREHLEFWNELALPTTMRGAAAAVNTRRATWSCLPRIGIQLHWSASIGLSYCPLTARSARSGRCAEQLRSTRPELYGCSVERQRWVDFGLA